MARYRPGNLVHIVFDNASLLSVGGFPTATATGTDLAGVARACAIPEVVEAHTPERLKQAVAGALAGGTLTTIVSKVEAIGPKSFHMDLPLLENRFQFKRALEALRVIRPRRDLRVAQKEASMADGQPSGVLAQLVEELNARRIRVVDLTTTLSPETPVIDLPPIFAPSPGLTLTEISRYDSRGPAWYWNVLTLGEHTGTHFDAPIHWITGKDLPENATDTIAPRKFVGPACVIDVTSDVRANQDFLLTPERVQSWETAHGRIPAGAWVLLRTGWSARTAREDFLNVRDDGPHSPDSPRHARNSWCTNAMSWASV